MLVFTNIIFLILKYLYTNVKKYDTFVKNIH